MKLNAWLLSALIPLAALSVLAQTPPPVPPPVDIAPPAATTEPAAKPKKPKTKAKAKAKPAKAAPVKGTIILNPPVTAIVKCDVLDVRAQGSFAGEVISRLKKGDSVTVLEEITLGHVRANEPEQWSRIAMPAKTPVWVDAAFVDPETKAVRAKKLNVRGGPGENYSIVGGLDKGSVVKEISKKEGWLQIEPPTDAFAFVASEYLEAPTEAPAPVVAAAPPAPPPAPVVVNVPAETPPPVPAKSAETAPAGLAAPAPTATSQADELAAAHRPPVSEPAVVAPVIQPEVTETPRIVTREGYARRSYNIQSPTSFELRDIKTDELTEYLQPAHGQKFKPYVGKRVRIVGAESLDPRWPRTPVLQIQTLERMP